MCDDLYDEPFEDNDPVGEALDAWIATFDALPELSPTEGEGE